MVPALTRSRDAGTGLRDEELDALYGFRPPARGRSLSARKIVWSVVGPLVLTVADFAYTQVPHARPPAYGVVPPASDVIYGIPTELAGELGICTDYVADRPGGRALGLRQRPPHRHAPRPRGRADLTRGATTRRLRRPPVERPQASPARTMRAARTGREAGGGDSSTRR